MQEKKVWITWLYYLNSILSWVSHSSLQGKSLYQISYILFIRHI